MFVNARKNVVAGSSYIAKPTSHILRRPDGVYWNPVHTEKHLIAFWNRPIRKG